MGTEIPGGGVCGGGVTITTATLSPTEWFCNKMGSSASHVNVSLIVIPQHILIKNCSHTKFIEWNVRVHVRDTQQSMNWHMSKHLGLTLSICLRWTEHPHRHQYPPGVKLQNTSTHEIVAHESWLQSNSTSTKNCYRICNTDLVFTDAACITPATTRVTRVQWPSLKYQEHIHSACL